MNLSPNCQLSTVNCQLLNLSPNCQLSTVNCQLLNPSPSQVIPLEEARSPKFA
ncbi:hypothetical protein [Microcoleus sp. bin48.metabat.b7b8b9.023]|uniref:hypothetical protein n=1 Tax=Microcoleus sp. bin48.metabat.b7b8b9.023 TaxID=2742710 RepID=UPI0025ED2759|nr:hypothetical protein [Microcoleus sp. bin48.metabat.b7b8b9.023]